ncbi:hypothetical protein, partial [Corynebacterium pseudodiphtheriticum]|uniref:hypothetical protein n=1 Tax=Corynebacterium pseudodiphtheriticum TaxID=37637 RepID=UPI0025503FC8
MTTPGQFSTQRPGNGSRIKMILAWVSVVLGILFFITSPTYGGFELAPESWTGLILGGLGFKGLISIL